MSARLQDVRAHKTSIVSAEAARRLLAALPKDDTVKRIGPMPDGTGRLEVITLSARRAGYWAGPWDRRRYKLSGGVKIEAEVKAPTYGGYRGYVRSRRLKPGWTPTQFLRAAAACHMDAWRAAHLQSYRENVYAAFQPYEADTALTEAAEAESENVPHTTIYDEMTQEDCIFWLDWLRTRTGGAAIPLYAPAHACSRHNLPVTPHQEDTARPVSLTDDEIDFLIEAIDSHEYWQLSESNERNNGASTAEDGEDPDIDFGRAISHRLAEAKQGHVTLPAVRPLEIEDDETDDFGDRR